MKKVFEWKYVTCHYIKSLLGFGIAGEKSTGCNDDYTIKYTSILMKVYLGPLIFNIHFSMFPKPINLDEHYEIKKPKLDIV